METIKNNIRLLQQFQKKRGGIGKAGDAMGVTHSAYWRWLHNERRMPPSARKLLEMLLASDDQASNDC